MNLKNYVFLLKTMNTCLIALFKARAKISVFMEWLYMGVMECWSYGKGELKSWMKYMQRRKVFLCAIASLREIKDCLQFSESHFLSRPH